jgi:DnaJ-domain-containing protein 1
MLAEALRRAASPDELLSLLGGGEAVASATDSELDLRALGFSERERKMLSWVDGEASVEDLSLASGLKPDAAFRALLVAKWLGLITLAPGTRRAAPAPGQLEERRLEAKYEEVQDADYFTILGLPRSAGADEVRRAYERLSQEFDPLRFSGHPDPTLQQRAQVVASLLEEAARALEDDRRRVEYARHLLD